MITDTMRKIQSKDAVALEDIVQDIEEVDLEGSDHDINKVEGEN